MRLETALLAGALLVAALFQPRVRSAEAVQERGRVSSLEVTLLSTMLADEGIGEWGFAALVEADGVRLLFDTGSRPDTVLENAKSLGIDLAGVREVILSHNHGDHTGGLLTLRRALAARDPETIGVAHVGRGIFWERPASGVWQPMPAVKQAYEELGGSVVEHATPVQLHPGVWLTGPVPRHHPERNWSLSPGARVRSPEGFVEDDIPESQSLVIDTDRGLVVISGCGHAGLVNTLDYARVAVRDTKVHAALGGFHLLRASDEHLAWTAGELRRVELEHFVGAHCTGIEAVFRLRALAGLTRETAVVGAVGASFSLAGGIDPLALAR